MATIHRLIGFARRALRTAPGALARELWWRLGRSLGRRLRARRDRTRTTYGPLVTPAPPLARFFAAVPLAQLEPDRERILALARAAADHRFDLLGSGPTEVRLAAAAPPLAERIPAPDRAEALRIAALLPPGYLPIDWQVDFKSGWRWSEHTWYAHIPIGHRPGVDVKLPWELARMQHLPHLAWAYAVDRDPRWPAEMRDQVLDFIAQNPPRFGVNWRCTMDVAIRIANWLVARDLFRAAGAEFDPAFEAELARAARDHGRHIIENLEWSPVLRGNHYLADVVGLLFVAAYLGDEAWRSFATRELIAAVDEQFTPDGANFEASTCYHRLSAELVVYATALAIRLGTRFPASYLERLERMAEFTVDVTKPSGRVAQIGDNDSGRFLKLAVGSVGDDLDHRHLVAAVNGLFGRDDLARFARGCDLDTAVVAALAGGGTLPSYRASGGPSPAATVRVEGVLPEDGGVEVLALEEPGLLGDLELRAYPDFGFYLFRGRRLWLGVRCGPIGQNGNGGHAHNDQLAIELAVDGGDRWVDPGTYVYTPDPAARNAYRSVHAHHAPRVAGREPGSLALGLFALGDEARAKCIYFGPRGFVGRHVGYGPAVERVVALGPGDRLRVIDRAGGGLVLAPPLPPGEQPPFSPAYGVRAGVRD